MAKFTNDTNSKKTAGRPKKVDVNGTVSYAVIKAGKITGYDFSVIKPNLSSIGKAMVEDIIRKHANGNLSDGMAIAKLSTELTGAIKSGNGVFRGKTAIGNDPIVQGVNHKAFYSTKSGEKAWHNCLGAMLDADYLVMKDGTEYKIEAEHRMWAEALAKLGIPTFASMKS